MTAKERKMEKVLKRLRDYLQTLTVPIEKLKPLVDEIDNALHK